MYEVKSKSKPKRAKLKKSSGFHRPCEKCANFKWLGGRFGVCESHECPSEPRACGEFKHRRKAV